MRDRIVPVDRGGRVAPLAAACGLAMALALPALAGEPVALATGAVPAPNAPLPAAAGSLDVGAATRFAALALKCLHQEYPNHISHTLNSDADARPPRELTPAFYGCFHWHSAAHAHWLLVRLAHLFPDAPFAGEARAAVSRSLTAANIEAEVNYLRGAGPASF